jgi:hypothetical protein
MVKETKLVKVSIEVYDWLHDQKHENRCRSVDEFLRKLKDGEDVY